MDFNDSEHPAERKHERGSDRKVASPPGVKSSSPSVVGQDEPREETELTENGVKNLALQAIDQLAAHPNDPQNPEGVKGVSDNELTELPLEDVTELIERTLHFAEENKQEPRHLFALGRAALLHGDEEFALELLEKATNQGSSAAHAYLARLTDDLDVAAEHLRHAVKGGFDPAREWLAQIEVAIEEEQQAAVSQPAQRPSTGQRTQKVKTRPFDFNQFAFPDLVKAFHSGDASPFARDPLTPLAYISSINDALNDQSVLFMLEQPKEFLRNISPSLSIEAQKKLLTNPNAVTQTTTAGFNAMKGFFQAIADTRRRGGSISEEVAAANSALLNGGQRGGGGNVSYMTIQEIKNQGTKDGRLLAMLFEQHPEDFQRIYKGMLRFVREEVR